MKVAEIFHSIQGEGIYAGVPMVFVRLQGCNFLSLFGCTWCDTSYAQDSQYGREMGIEEVVKEVEKNSYFGSWVCITGGEPLFQVMELEQLVRELKKFGYKIEIETNGTLPRPRWYTLVDSWVPDIKCPSSGVCGKSLEEWLDIRYCDQVKLVVKDGEDLIFAGALIDKNGWRSPTFLVSPVMPCSKEWMERVVEFCKAHRVRFSLQVHKVIWGNRKGV